MYAENGAGQALAARGAWARAASYTSSGHEAGAGGWGRAGEGNSGEGGCWVRHKLPAALGK